METVGDMSVESIKKIGLNSLEFSGSGSSSSDDEDSHDRDDEVEIQKTVGRGQEFVLRVFYTCPLCCPAFVFRVLVRIYFRKCANFRIVNSSLL